jgi:hypothetical protein
MTRLGLLIVLTLVASGCGGTSRSTVASGSAGAQGLHDLHDMAQLRTAFNTASKQPRLIVLVSPT